MNLNKFKKYLSKYNLSKTILVGLGNEARGDDGAGLLLIQKLRRTNVLNKVHFIQVGRTPENYLQKILSQKPDLVIFVDSISCQNFDEIQLFSSELLEEHNFSTHSYSIKLISEYLKKYGDPEIQYLGIPANNTNIGYDISSDVKNRINNFLHSDRN